jgi:carboxyl-terminal processing protease
MHLLPRILLLVALVACSEKRPPTSGEAARPTAEAAAAMAAVPPPDPREEALSKIMVQLVEEEHLLRKRLDDSVSRMAFDTYVDRLDGSKMFLLQADKDALAPLADKIDDELRTGNLELAHAGAKTFVARVTVVQKMVEGLLAAPFDSTDSEFLELDPEKTELAKTDDELRERWRRRLEHEVLERVAAMEARLAANGTGATGAGATTGRPGAGSGSGTDDDDDLDEVTTPLSAIPTTAEGREAKARADLAKSYAGRFARLENPGHLEAASDLINAVTAALDPHSNYLPPADKANFDIQMTGSLEGIGAVLRERDHNIEILELVPGGAAWRQGGLAPGDLIMSVAEDGKDPVDTFDMRIDEVVKMIRGPKNTVVKLRVQKPAGTTETVAITRDVIVIEAAYARGALVTPAGGATYGYIHLPSFYNGKQTGQRASGEDVAKLLAEMKDRRVKGVVLDLRSNGGGVLGDAIEVTGALIDRGPVVQVQDSDGTRKVLADKKAGVAFDGPVVVLVDRFAASASEIVAGALQDYQRAVIVGTGPTHGKGTVQTLADLDAATGGAIELGVVKLTVQQYFRISGASTQREGVAPDIVLPDPAGHVESGERELDNAIPWSSVDEVSHADWRVTWNKADLVKRSAARVAKDPILTKIATAIEVLRARREDTRVPLEKGAWEARRKEQRAALEAALPDLDKTGARFAVKPIDDPDAPVIAPGPGGKVDDRPAKWRDGIARDPWIDESLHILADMTR